MRVAPELLVAPLHELSALLDKGEITSEELVRATIERTEALEPELNSYITFLPERALEASRRSDEQRRRGESKSLLHGIPISLKDVFDTAEIATTAGARFLKNHEPTTDAEVTRRLDEAGTILMGKANLNKFAGGESGENPDFGNMRNPWNRNYSPSGSSGGSAAQVATGLAALSVGSDNGGSVRNPASVCNVVGLKPTHGRISTEGMFPRAYSIDHAGPITRTVKDAAIVMRVLAGHRDGDTTTSRRGVPDYEAELDGSVRGTKLGIDRELARVAEPAVTRIFERALRKLEEIGCENRRPQPPDARRDDRGDVSHLFVRVGRRTRAVDAGPTRRIWRRCARRALDSGCRLSESTARAAYVSSTGSSGDEGR